MPKRLTSQEYDSLVQDLERVADGIAKHKEDEGFPNQLNEDNRRQLRTDLEDLRGTWEKMAAETDRAYDAYFAHFDLCKKQIAKDNHTLRGYYGTDSSMLIDYGTKALGKPSGQASSKKKSPKTPPTTPET